MAILLVLIGWLHLGTLVLTVLFGYFALRLFSLGRSKVLAVAVYLIRGGGDRLRVVLFYAPDLQTTAGNCRPTIPAVVGFAEKKSVELPFTDYASLKTVAINEVQGSVANIGRYVRAAAFQFVLLLVGLVVAVSLFLSARWGTETIRKRRGTVYMRPWCVNWGFGSRLFTAVSPRSLARKSSFP